MTGWQSLEVMYEGYTFIEDASLEERNIAYRYYDPRYDTWVDMRPGNQNNG